MALQNSHHIRAMPDYARHADVIRALELISYDFERAKEVVTEEMLKLGATLVNGMVLQGGR